VANCGIEYLLPMNGNKWTWQDDRSAVPIRCERRDRRLNFGVVAHGSGGNLNLHRLGRSLEEVAHATAARERALGMDQICDAINFRRDFLEQLHPFAKHGIHEVDKARDIPAGMRPVGNKP
jgi:hypothetical protein